MLIELANPIYNDSTTILGISGVYTAAATSVRQAVQNGSMFSRYNNFNVNVITDQASAANGLQIQGSQDGSSNWKTVAQGSVVANIPLTLSTPVTYPYYRIVLTNGAVAQTSLSLTSGFTA